MILKLLGILVHKGGETVSNFTCKTKIITGRGSVARLKELGIHRLLMVADPYFVQNGTAENLAKLTGAAETELFSKIEPDPSVELTAMGTAVVKRFQPDTVVALGGGSAMDCAKAMAYFASHKGSFVAIPTTSGSGSEVTDFAILTSQGCKHPLVDESLVPDVAILDADLLDKLPQKLIADTGFDVLAHAVEALAAKNSGLFTQTLSKTAFSVVYGNLRASHAGNRSVRQCIHEASAMAGVAFSQSGLGLCHSISHVLGGMFHVPHGRLNAIFLPGVIRTNAHLCADRYAGLARFAGIPGASDTMAVRNLCTGLERLRRDLAMPGTLKEAGVDPRQLRADMPRLVEQILQDPCSQTNPIPAEDFMVRRLLEGASGGL